MKDRLQTPTPTHHGPGLKLVLLALLLVAIAAAADIAWMSPGRATMPDRVDQATAQREEAPVRNEAAAIALGRVPAAAREPEARAKTL